MGFCFVLLRGVLDGASGGVHVDAGRVRDMVAITSRQCQPSCWLFLGDGMTEEGEGGFLLRGIEDCGSTISQWETR